MKNIFLNQGILKGLGFLPAPRVQVPSGRMYFLSSEQNPVRHHADGSVMNAALPPHRAGNPIEEESRGKQRQRRDK